MPPRIITIAILAFWALTVAWLFQRDLWPRLDPGEPPPFTVELMDGAGGTHPPRRWTATLTTSTGEEVYSVETRVVPRESDQLGLTANIRRRSLVSGGALPPFQRMTSEYVVAKDAGELDRARMRGFQVRVERPDLLGGALGELVSTIEGEVRDGLCHLRWTRKLDGREWSGEGAVEVSHNGIVLLPLHPVHRIAHVEPGQAWSVWMVDPAESALSSSVSPVLVRARVLPETETLIQNRRERRCLVIEYDGDHFSGRTWVDASSPDERGWVLRMEIQIGGRKWTITRD